MVVHPQAVPRDLLNVVDYLVPELQRRGRFRTRYEGRTLRDNPGGVGASRGSGSEFNFVELDPSLFFFFGHDLFRKPLHTFRDHALVRERCGPRLPATTRSRPRRCSTACR